MYGSTTAICRKYRGTMQQCPPWREASYLIGLGPCEICTDAGLVLYVSHSLPFHERVGQEMRRHQRHSRFHQRLLCMKKWSTRQSRTANLIILLRLPIFFLQRLLLRTCDRVVSRLGATTSLESCQRASTPNHLRRLQCCWGLHDRTSPEIKHLPHNRNCKQDGSHSRSH